jgi:hypothetical protein
MNNAMKLRQSLTLLLLMSCICLGQAPKHRSPKKAPSAKFLALQIGGAFTLPECEKRDSAPMMYAPGLAHWCWQDLSGIPKTGSPEPTPVKDSVLIHMPPAEAPPYIVNNLLTARIEDGKVQTVSFHTNGVRAIEDILEAMTSMYGTPTKQESIKVENNVGVEFQSTNALWLFTDLTVDYQGVDGELSVGTVWVETPSARQRRIPSAKTSEGQAK